MVGTDIPDLVFLDLGKIRPNKKNPRGPNVRDNDLHRENLKESVAQFGILVPLVVRPISSQEYELIDGERRYWVAKSLKLEKVPAFVLNGKLDTKSILQRMFQIHMNRDQWDPVQQCKASESFYSELLESHKDDIEGLVHEFAKFTGDDRRTARNRVQFLRWPDDVKNSIYEDSAKHDSYWYVVEIEDKIVEPALKNFPEYFKRVDVNHVRRFLYRKWDSKAVGAAVDVRPAAAITRSKIKSPFQRKKALKIFHKLVTQQDFTYHDAHQEFAREFPELVEPKLPKPRSVLNTVRNLSVTLLEYEPQYLQAYGKGKQLMDDLTDAVRELISAAHRFLKKM